MVDGLVHDIHALPVHVLAPVTTAIAPELLHAAIKLADAVPPVAVMLVNAEATIALLVVDAVNRHVVDPMIA